MGSYETTMLKLEQMAQKNTAQGQQWQERMSNTSHQREVKDLVAAGLNPVLSSGGSGAQSYTTTVDSAVSGIAGMASAREGANATRYAARQSAAATRAAAAAQIAAAREAAAASRYASDRAYNASKYTADTNYRTQMDKPVSNPWALIDKHLLNNSKIDQSSIKLFKDVARNINKFQENPSRWFRQQQDKIRYNNFKLNSSGIKDTNKQLGILGIPKTAHNRSLLVQATLFGKPLAISLIGNLIQNARGNSSASLSYRSSLR